MSSYSYTFDEYVDYIRKKYPNEVSDLGSQGVYLYGKTKENTPNVEPIKLPVSQPIHTPVPQSNKEVRTDPSFLGSLADYWVDADSPDWMKSAYVNSLTGLTEEVIYGKPRYDLSDYDPNLLEEIGAGLLGFIFPLDLAAFGVGGKIGGAVIKGVGAPTIRTIGSQLTNLGAQGISKRFSLSGINQTIVKNIAGKSSQAWIGNVADVALNQSIRTGFQLGTYEAAGSGLRAATYVGPNGEKLTSEEILKETLGGFVHGMALGGIAGYGAGFLGSKWTEIGKRIKAKKSAGKKLNARDVKMLSRTKHAIPNAKAFGWEVGVFTAPSVVDEYAKMQEGQGFDLTNIFHTAIVNAGMVGVMHSTRHVFSKANAKLESWNKDITSDIQKAFSEKSSFDRLQDYFSSQEQNSSGPEKAAYQKALEVLGKEKNQSSDKIKFNIEQRDRLIKEISDVIKDLDINIGLKKPEQLIAISKRIAKGMRAVNEAIGLTGDKELAKLMNDFSADIIKNIKINTSSTSKSKNSLIASYRALRGKNKRDKNKIIVERDGQAIEINIRDAHKYSRKDLRNAINAEADGAFHGAAKNTFQAMDAANKIEPYNRTSDFVRGFKFDAEGNPIPADNLKTSKHRTSKGFSEKSGRTKEVSDRAKKLEKTHDEISKDSASMDSTVETRNKYSQSKSIILNFLEKFYLNATVGDKFLSTSTVRNRVKGLNKFAKWLAEKKEKNLYEASQADIKQFLKNEGNRTHAIALKELIESKRSKFNKTHDTKEFKSYSELLPDKATTTTPNEHSTRIKERELSSKLNYTKEQLRDIREEVTGKRRFKDMTEAEKVKVSKYISKVLKKPYESTSRELRNLESQILIRAEKIGFGPNNVRKLLRILGVKDGSFKNVKSVETLKEALQWMREKPAEFLTSKEKSSSTNFFVKMTSKVFNTLPLPSAIKRFFMPGWYVLKHYGGEPGKKLYKSYIDSQVTYESMMGNYNQSFYKISKLLKASDRDKLRFVDEVLRKSAKSKKDLEFIDKMLNEKGQILIDGKPIILKEGQLVPRDAVFEGGSKQWQAMMHWKQYTDGIWRNLDIAIKNTVSRGEYLKFKQKFDPKYVSTYFSRVMNPEVVKAIFSGREQGFVIDLAKRELTRSANAEADKLGLKKGTNKRKKFVDEYVNNENNIAEITSEIHDYITNNINKINPKYLKKRGIDISDSDGMVEITTGILGRKKRVKAYVENFDAVSRNYANSMAGAISGAAHFPELTGFSPKRHGVAKQSIVEMSNSGGMAAYASKMIMRHLGLESSLNQKINSKTYRFLGGLTNAGVALGLSTPILPGLKNLAIGQARNVGAFGLMNSVRGFVAAFSRTSQKTSRELGHFESGTRSLDLLQKGLGLSTKPIIRHFNMQTQFKWWNFMQPSEAMNRISSKVAGMLYFEETMRRYKGEMNVIGNWNQKNAKEFKRFLSERLHFTPEEMAYIDKTPLHRLLSSKNPTDVAVMTHLTQKAAHFMHISTQGGTQVGMLPLWMSSPLARPMTLFYRMASAATFDTYVNFIKPAVTHRNPFPLVRLAAAHMVTGNALYALYKQLGLSGNPLEGLDPKDEAGKTNQMLSEMFTDAYKSGFFGTVEGVFSPYTGLLSGQRPYASMAQIGQGGLPMMDPILLRYSQDMLKNTMQLFFERPETRYTMEEWTEKTIGNLLSDISSFGSQYRNMWISQNAPYLKDRKDLRRLYNNYQKSIGEDRVPFGGAWEDPAYFMFDDMRTEIFKKGATHEDKTKAVMLVYNTIVHELMSDGLNGAQSHKEAIKRIKSSLAASRPVPITWKVKAEDNKKYRDFYNGIDKEWQDKLHNAEAEFNILKKEVTAILNHPYSFITYGNLGGIENIMHNKDYNPTDFYKNLSDEDKKLYEKYRLFN
tara:strand:+ start:11213 stop:16882 length:5670 start_codon:yes stop_codon:yes gene_type:complete